MYTRILRVGAALMLLVTSILAFGAVSPTPAAAATLSMRGADLGSLQRAVDLGEKFYNASGVAQDPLQILKGVGMNYVRLRIWNNPPSGYNNETKVLAYAKVVKAAGLSLMVDFHYSDYWADPGKQFPPAAWANDNITQLQTDLYNYTYKVCTDLKNQGTTPDSVQIGNEINTGMDWPVGRVVNNNFTNLALLLKSGYNAIKACNSSTQVIIHTADTASDSAARWFYDGIKAQGVNWDVTGLSYYCYWHGSMSNMTSVVSDMRSRYGKSVILAETAYPFTSANADGTTNSVTASTPCSGYPATSAGQAANFTNTVNAAAAGGAVGVFYWEPTWVAYPGNGWDPTNINGSGDQWDNQAIFDWTGHINPSFSWTGSAPPPPTPTPPAGSNLALNKAATTDSTQSGHPASAGNDGNTTTRWTANDGNLNHWWQVDLGANHNLTGSQVMFEFNGRAVGYTIQVSTNNTSWTTVVNKTSNTNTAQTQSDSFTSTARYVRITTTALPANTWASFFEFSVFGV